MKVDNKKNKLFCVFAGILCGFLNGFFGAGGGTLAVPLLKKAGLSENESHAGAVAVILPVTIVSAVFYLLRGDVLIADSLPFVFTGMLGAVLGAFLLKKISGKWLRRIFGALVIFASVRMLIK